MRLVVVSVAALGLLLCVTYIHFAPRISTVGAGSWSNQAQTPLACEDSMNTIVTHVLPTTQELEDSLAVLQHHYPSDCSSATDGGRYAGSFFGGPEAHLLPAARTVVDVFFMGTEVGLAELRIMELASVVQYFVVVEADIGLDAMARRTDFPSFERLYLRLPSALRSRVYYRKVEVAQYAPFFPCFLTVFCLAWEGKNLNCSRHHAGAPAKPPAPDMGWLLLQRETRIDGEFRRWAHVALMEARAKLFPGADASTTLVLFSDLDEWPSPAVVQRLRCLERYPTRLSIFSKEQWQAFSDPTEASFVPPKPPAFLPIVKIYVVIHMLSLRTFAADEESSMRIVAAPLGFLERHSSLDFIYLLMRYNHAVRQYNRTLGVSLAADPSSHVLRAGFGCSKCLPLDSLLQVPKLGGSEYGPRLGLKEGMEKLAKRLSQGGAPLKVQNDTELSLYFPAYLQLPQPRLRFRYLTELPSNDLRAMFLKQVLVLLKNVE